MKIEYKNIKKYISLKSVFIILNTTSIHSCKKIINERETKKHLKSVNKNAGAQYKKEKINFLQNFKLKLSQDEYSLLKENVKLNEDIETVVTILGYITSNFDGKTNTIWIKIKNHLIQTLTEKWDLKNTWNKRENLYNQITELSTKIKIMQKTQIEREEKEIQVIKDEQQNRGVFKKMLPTTYWKDIKKVIKLLKSQIKDVKIIKKLNKDLLQKTNDLIELEKKLLNKKNFIYTIKEMQRLKKIYDSMKDELDNISDERTYNKKFNEYKIQAINLHKKFLVTPNEYMSRLLVLESLSNLTNKKDINLSFVIAKNRLNIYKNSKFENKKNFNQIKKSILKIWEIGFDLYESKKLNDKKNGAKILILSQLLFKDIMTNIKLIKSINLPLTQKYNYNNTENVILIKDRLDLKTKIPKKSDCKYCLLKYF